MHSLGGRGDTWDVESLRLVIHILNFYSSED